MRRSPSCGSTLPRAVLQRPSESERLAVTADVYLGDVKPEEVAVQLYEGVLDTNGEIERGRAHNMIRHGESDNGEGWHRYRLEFVPDKTGRYGYTVRLIPHHFDMRRTMHLGLITWAG